jgi:hypothetical protein
MEEEEKRPDESRRYAATVALVKTVVRSFPELWCYLTVLISIQCHALA